MICNLIIGVASLVFGFALAGLAYRDRTEPFKCWEFWLSFACFMAVNLVRAFF